MEELAGNAKVALNHIPFKGNADLTQAVLGGHVMAQSDASGWDKLVEAGQLRLLVTFGEKRTKRWPQVPTAQELGYNVVATSPYGLVGPKGMDPAVVKTLHDAFKKAMDEPRHLELLDQLNQDMWYRSGADYAKWARETFAQGQGADRAARPDRKVLIAPAAPAGDRTARRSSARFARRGPTVDVLARPDRNGVSRRRRQNIGMPFAEAARACERIDRLRQRAPAWKRRRHLDDPAIVELEQQRHLVAGVDVASQRNDAAQIGAGQVQHAAVGERQRHSRVGDGDVGERRPARAPVDRGDDLGVERIEDAHRTTSPRPSGTR
jgi:hypothetical protein